MNRFASKYAQPRMTSRGALLLVCVLCLSLFICVAFDAPARRQANGAVAPVLLTIGVSNG